MTERIRCREAVQRLWDFLDHELGESDRREVEEHLAFCRRCCGELAFARELRHVLGTRSGEDLPSDVQCRLEDVIDGLDGSTERGANT